MKDSNSAEERIKFLQEAAIMKQFAHQNVVFMFGVVTKRYPVSLLFHYLAIYIIKFQQTCFRFLANDFASCLDIYWGEGGFWALV